jgi:hypothetical protein
MREALESCRTVIRYRYIFDHLQISADKNTTHSSDGPTAAPEAGSWATCP